MLSVTATFLTRPNKLTVLLKYILLLFVLHYPTRNLVPKDRQRGEGLFKGASYTQEET